MEKEVDQEYFISMPDIDLEIVEAREIDAGHMMYQKLLVKTDDGNSYFVKTSDDSLLTDENEAVKMWHYLIKEQFAYDILERSGYKSIPAVELNNRSLVMEYLSEGDGWSWQAPQLNHDAYIKDILSALRDLEDLPVSEELEKVELTTSAEKLFNRGWAIIDENKADTIAKKSLEYNYLLKNHVLSGADLIDMFAKDRVIRKQVTKETKEYIENPTSNIGHFDARQANIGWHPERGVKIIDWSWASKGPAKSDRTMFIIDLHKSGIDVSDYLDDNFDENHAKLLIGYWLARSAEPAYNNSGNVRFHQFASAVSVASLLKNI